MRTRISRLLVSAALSAAAVTVLPGHATAMPPPPETCTDPEPAHPTVRAQPWAQQMFDPQSIWPYSRGRGVTVAVVDSGVDDDHPQLNGKVLPGKDFYYNGGFLGTFDCVSHGTGVAGIIAARPVRGVGFAGLAPDSTILPVRVVDREVNDDGQVQAIDYGVLAKGIRYAVDSGAKVLNLSLSGNSPNSEVRSAIAYAQSKDVVVVAAVGNVQQGEGTHPTYPSSYPGVLGVGGVSISEEAGQVSQVGPQVDLMAPGEGVLTSTRAGGHRYADGTSFAAPFVSATVALVRSAYPQLSAKQVVQRIMATANPAAGGKKSEQYGIGLVSPYRAVTDKLAGVGPQALPVVNPQHIDKEQVRKAAWWAGAGSDGRAAAAIGTGAAAILLIVALILVRGKRSRWTPRRAAPPPARTLPTDEPPDEVFLLPPPAAER